MTADLIDQLIKYHLPLPNACDWTDIYFIDNDGGITMRCAHCLTKQFGRLNDLNKVCPYCKGTGVKDIGDIL